MSDSKWQRVDDDSIEVLPYKCSTPEEYCIVCGRTLGDHGVISEGKHKGEVVCPAEVDDD